MVITIETGTRIYKHCQTTLITNCCKTQNASKSSSSSNEVSEQAQTSFVHNRSLALWHTHTHAHKTQTLVRSQQTVKEYCRQRLRSLLKSIWPYLDKIFSTQPRLFAVRVLFVCGEDICGLHALTKHGYDDWIRCHTQLEAPTADMWLTAAHTQEM